MTTHAQWQKINFSDESSDDFGSDLMIVTKIVIEGVEIEPMTMYLSIKALQSGGRAKYSCIYL